MKTLKNTMLFLAALLPVACSNNKTDYDASGIFESTEVIVSSQVSGQLMEFTVTEGQQLQADSYLGYVDTTQLYLKKQQLMASRTAVSSRSTSVRAWPQLTAPAPMPYACAAQRTSVR